MVIKAARLSKVLVILLVLFVVGLLIVQVVLGHQLARRVHATTNHRLIAATGASESSTLTYSLLTDQSNHLFTLSSTLPLAFDAFKNAHFRIEHTITHGPLRLIWLNHRPSIQFAAGWVTTHIFFPPELKLEPMQFESKVRFNGSINSDFQLPPTQFQSGDELLEWSGLSGTLNFHRASRHAELDVELGQFYSRNATAEARMTRAHLFASGPINRFQGERKLSVTIEEASLSYLADIRRNEVRQLEFQFESQDQRPLSSVNLQLRIDRILVDNQPYHSARLNLSLQRIAAAQLMDMTNPTPLMALTALLANRPELIADAAVTSPDGDAEVYLSMIVGPLDFTRPPLPTPNELIDALDIASHLRLPREVLLALFQAQYRLLERENVQLLPPELRAAVTSTWKDNALLQLSMVEQGKLVSQDGNHLISDLSLNRGIVTVNQQKFNLFTLLAPFLE